MNPNPISSDGTDRKDGMRKWYRRIAMFLTVVALTAAGFAWWFVRQAHHVPEFYRLATERELSPEELRQQAEAGKRLAASFLRLRNEALKQGRWKAAFDNEEINAWLASELPQKFPKLLRIGMSQPRVAIEDGKLLAAARLTNRRIDTVLSCEIKVELTEQANILAIRLENLRAGALPLPWYQFSERISQEAATGDVVIQWDQTDSGPIALLEIPSEHPDFIVKPLVVESIVLADGEIRLAGRSGQAAHGRYRPRTPVYQFVSYQPIERPKRQARRHAARRQATPESEPNSAIR